MPGNHLFHARKLKVSLEETIGFALETGSFALETSGLADKPLVSCAETNLLALTTTNGESNHIFSTWRIVWRTMRLQGSSSRYKRNGEPEGRAFSQL